MGIENFKLKEEKKIKDFISRILEEIFNSPAQNLMDLDDIQHQFLRFWVYKYRRKIVGTIGLKKEGIRYKISRMYVDKYKRNKGIGTLLIKEVFKYCKTNSINTIFLTTYPKMDSVGFYKKMGFKIVKTENKVITMKIIM